MTENRKDHFTWKAGDLEYLGNVNDRPFVHLSQDELQKEIEKTRQKTEFPKNGTEFRDSTIMLQSLNQELKHREKK